MANLLIGSSNVNRFYKAPDFPNVRQYKMVKCTQKTGFDAYMGTLASSSRSVLVSVIENFVVDAVGADSIEPENAIDKCIKDFLCTIIETASKNLETKFGIVMPLRRPAVPWYQERIGLISNLLEDGIKFLSSEKDINNITSIRVPSETSQQFEDDKIHLTKASAKIFLDIILGAAERFFTSEMVDLTENVDKDQMKVLEDRLTRLEQ
jgi:hypothetical protein